MCIFHKIILSCVCNLLFFTIKRKDWGILPMHQSMCLSANTGPIYMSVVHLTSYYNYMLPCLFPIWVSEYGKCVLCIFVSPTSDTVSGTVSVQYLLIYCIFVHTRKKEIEKNFSSIIWKLPKLITVQPSNGMLCIH